MSSDKHAHNALARRRPATAVVRVVLDADDTLLHGELADAAGGPPERFAGWEGLLAALRHWINEQRQGQHRTSPGDAERR